MISTGLNPNYFCPYSDRTSGYYITLSKGEVNMAYKTIYPFTNETLKEYANHTDAELEQAIASGHALYK